jgi:hypothetical protein
MASFLVIASRLSAWNMLLHFSVISKVSGSWKLVSSTEYFSTLLFTTDIFKGWSCNSHEEGNIR